MSPPTPGCLPAGSAQPWPTHSGSLRSTAGWRTQRPRRATIVVLESSRYTYCCRSSTTLILILQLAEIRAAKGKKTKTKEEEEEKRRRKKSSLIIVLEDDLDFDLDLGDDDDLDLNPNKKGYNYVDFAGNLNLM